MHTEKWYRFVARNIFAGRKMRFLPAISKETMALTVIVRMYPLLGRRVYVHRALLLLIMGSYWFFSLIIMLSLGLDGSVSKLWMDLGGSPGYVFAALFSLQHLDLQQDVYVLAAWFYIVLFFLAIWMALSSRYSWQELKLLQMFSRLDASHIHDFTIGKHLRITHPLWIQSDVVEAPTPSHLLEVLKEREGLDDEWVAKIISTLQSEPTQDLSEHRFLLSLTDRVTLSMLGAIEVQEPLSFSHVQAALVSFLATAKKGVWIPKDEIVSSVYGVESETNINVLRSRVNASVRAYIRTMDLFDTEDEGGDDGMTPIELIEIDRRGNNSFWRLSRACDVAIFAELGRFYQSICERQRQQVDVSPLSIEDLQIACEQNVRVYGSGFLSKHFQASAMPHWVQQHYCLHRDRWLHVLTYAIERERTSLNEVETAQGKNDAARVLARLYSQRAFAATGAVPLAGYGQHDLIQSLKILRQLKSIGSAREICHEYVARRRAIDKTWDVNEKLSVIWPDAFKRVAYRSKET